MATTRVTDLQALTTPDGSDVLHAVDVSADRDSKLTISGLQTAIGGAFAPVAHQHSTGEITNFNASSRAQTEAALVAGANITLTPAGSGATRTITVAASGGGGGGGTVTQVDGGAGLTGSVTTSGSLAVGAGTGIAVAADSVSINRTTTDAWYATAAQGALAATALQPGSVDLGFTAATRTITNTAGDPAVLPLVTSGAAGLAPQSGGGTTNFLRADGTWAAPPAGGGGATSLDGLSDVTLTAPATDQVLKFNGSEWVNAAAPGGGGGTVTQVTGGAGLTGLVTTTGALAVGAGTGITVNADDVAVNRTVVDGWYATAAQGALAATALQPGSVDLSYNPATRTISNTAGDGVVLPVATNSSSNPGMVKPGTGLTWSSDGTLSVGIMTSFAAGLAPASGGGTSNFLRADGTWVVPSAGGATDLDGLSDVSILTPASGQILGFNAGFWRNMTPGNLFLAQSNPTGVTGADAITNMISLTQAEYDAIVTKNASTLYVITA